MRRFVAIMLVLAAAAIGVSSFAIAPTIASPPDVVITRDTAATAGLGQVTDYVYPDALNLDNLAIDDTVTSREIVWSFAGGFDNYKVSGVVTTGPSGTVSSLRQRYLLNTNRSIQTLAAAYPTSINRNEPTLPGVYEIGYVTGGAPYYNLAGTLVAGAGSAASGADTPYAAWTKTTSAAVSHVAGAVVYQKVLVPTDVAINGVSVGSAKVTTTTHGIAAAVAATGQVAGVFASVTTTGVYSAGTAYQMLVVATSQGNIVMNTAAGADYTGLGASGNTGALAAAETVNNAFTAGYYKLGAAQMSGTIPAGFMSINGAVISPDVAIATTNAVASAATDNFVAAINNAATSPKVYAAVKANTTQIMLVSTSGIKVSYATVGALTTSTAAFFTGLDDAYGSNMNYFVVAPAAQSAAGGILSANYMRLNGMAVNLANVSLPNASSGVIVSAINARTSTTGVTASLTSDNTIILQSYSSIGLSYTTTVTTTAVATSGIYTIATTSGGLLDLTGDQIVAAATTTGDTSYGAWIYQAPGGSPNLNPVFVYRVLPASAAAGSALTGLAVVTNGGTYGRTVLGALQATGTVPANVLKINNRSVSATDLNVTTLGTSVSDAIDQYAALTGVHAYLVSGKVLLVTSNASVGITVDYTSNATPLSAITGLAASFGTNNAFFYVAPNKADVTLNGAGLNAGDVLVNGYPLAAVASGTTDAIFGANLIAAINALTDRTGLTATYASGTNKITLTGITDINVTYSVNYGAFWTGVSAISDAGVPNALMTIANDDLVPVLPVGLRVTTTSIVLDSTGGSVTTQAALYYASGRRDDKNPRTITFRDSVLSPIGGPYTDPTVDIAGNPVADGSVIAYSPVTLIASDTTTYSASNTFFVYTKYAVTSSAVVSTLQDPTTGAGVLAVGIPSTVGHVNGTTTTTLLYEYTPGYDNRAWTYTQYANATTSGSSGDGLCLVASVNPNGNAGAIRSLPYYYNLTANKVYRLRATVNAKAGTDLVAGYVPFWDIMLDNYNADGTSDGKYIVDFYNIDHNGGNNGGANAGSANSIAYRNQFDIWFAPPQLNSVSWNGGLNGNGTTYFNDANPLGRTDYGAFGTAHRNTNGFSINFRLLDTNYLKGFGNDFGSVCFKSFSLVAVPNASLSVASTLWTGSPAANGGMWKYATSNITTNNNYSGAATTYMTYPASGDAVTFQPNLSNSFVISGLDLSGTKAWNNTVIQVYPGFYNGNGVLSDYDSTGLVLTVEANGFINDSELSQQWPVPWVSNELLKASVVASAPNANAQNYPVDALLISIDNPTYELMQDAMVVYSSSNHPTGMPAYGTDTEYVSFFYTHNKSSYTNSLISGNNKSADAQRLRMKVSIINNPNIVSGGRLNQDLSAITLKTMKIQLLAIPYNLAG